MKNNKLIILMVFLVLISIVTTCGTNWIHGKDNQLYIESILHEDLKLKSEYGKVDSYKIIKVGRYFGGQNEPIYDYYTLKIQGDKKSSHLHLRLYKNKDDQIYRYEITR